ncbi:MAG: hypothetical protein U1D30_06695 [Planctomycetota bacterium]
MMMNPLNRLFAKQAQLRNRTDRVGMGIGFRESPETGELRPGLAEELKVDRFHEFVVLRSKHGRAISESRAKVPDEFLILLF